MKRPLRHKYEMNVSNPYETVLKINMLQKDYYAKKSELDKLVEDRSKDWDEEGEGPCPYYKNSHEKVNEEGHTHMYCDSYYICGVEIYLFHLATTDGYVFRR